MLSWLHIFCPCSLTIAPPFYPEVPLLAFPSNIASHGESLDHSAGIFKFLAALHYPSLSLAVPIQKDMVPDSCYSFLFLLQKLSAGRENPTTTQTRATADFWLRHSPPPTRLSVLPLTLISSFLHCPQWLFQIFSIFFKTFSILPPLENNFVFSIIEKNKEVEFF